MNFKCLLEILKEKGYIKIKTHQSYDIIVSLTICSKYKKVREKIIDSLPDNTQYLVTRNEIVIMTTNDIEEWCIRNIQRNKKQYYKVIEARQYFNRDEYYVFLKILPLLENIKYEKLYDDRIKLIDIKAEEEYKKAKQAEEQEVEDFINSLP